MKIVGILILAALAAQGKAAGVQPEHSVEIRGDGVSIVLSLPKTSYMEGEPVLVKITLVNISDNPQRLAEPDYDWSVLSLIVSDSADSQSGQPDANSTIALPADYGWNYAPGQARSIWLPLNVRSLCTGNYAVRAEYSAPPHVKNVWHGTLTTPALHFSIVAPPERLAQVATAFRKFGRSTEDWRELAQSHRAVQAQGEAAGPFAPYAAFFEALAYRAAGDSAQFLKLARLYADSHKDVPFYGLHARRLLACDLYTQGKYAEARAEYAKLPDCYSTRSHIEMCDRRLGEQPSDD